MCYSKKKNKNSPNIKRFQLTRCGFKDFKEKMYMCVG